MIPFDFEYYRPGSVKEAVSLYQSLDGEGRAPVWYGGGSELISMARLGNLRFGAVIDIKNIPECRTLDFDGEQLHLGAALTLEEISRSQKFPLLGKTAGRVADHTMQCRITFGGNLASTIIYREAALPLLLSDAVVTTAGIHGLKTYSIHDIFKERLTLPKGELLLGAAVSREYIEAPFFHVKKTKNEKIDYPLLTSTALIAGGALRLAFSGFASYPFRDRGAEKILEDRALDDAGKADLFAKALSGIALSDASGSSGYRQFVLKNTVQTILEAVKEAGLPCLY